jgi:hypothetical protein
MFAAIDWTACADHLRSSHSALTSTLPALCPCLRGLQIAFARSFENVQPALFMSGFRLCGG